MRIYIRKIDTQSINKQMSYTEEIHRNFLDDLPNNATIICEGKNSKKRETVIIQLATDARFSRSIQKVLSAEGELAVGDLMVMYKFSSKYVLELLKPSDERHAVYSELFNGGRHLLLESDDTMQDSADFSDVLNHNLYGIHIKLQNDALSDTNPHICIGWSEMGDLSSIDTKDALGTKYDATWPGKKPKKKGQDIGPI